MEHAVAQLLEALHYKPEGRGLDSRPHYGPGVDSASNRNEYREYFLGGKGGRCVGADNFTTFMCRLSTNLGVSTSWNSQGLSRHDPGIPFFTLKMSDSGLWRTLCLKAILWLLVFVLAFKFKTLYPFLVLMLDIVLCFTPDRQTLAELLAVLLVVTGNGVEIFQITNLYLCGYDPGYCAKKSRGLSVKITIK